LKSFLSNNKVRRLHQQKRFDVTFPGDDELETIHMYNDFCKLFGNPIKCCTCSYEDSDMVLLNPNGELPLGTGEGLSGHSASILGRLWKACEDYYYVPTMGHDAIKGRYPPKVRKDPTSFKEAAKQSTQIIARGAQEQKVGLIYASVLYDMVFGRDSGRPQY
jgi:hypothetical protein